MNGTNVKYYLLLRYIPRLGRLRIKRLFERGDTAAEIWQQFQGQVKAVSAVKREVKKELESAEELGIRIVTYHDQEYPQLLREIPDAPILLYVKGEILPEDEVALAVVGTRKVSSYGKEAIRAIIPQLCAAGLTIVSGMARGADTSAHQTALAAGGRTIAVLGSGLDVVYPPENAGLLERISHQGAAISEFPLGFEPSNYSFPVRNRIISGMSLGTWVVEAPEKSGALITADSALAQNREVFVLPGSIFTSTARGTNRLIKQGAAVVTSSEDIIEILNLDCKKAGLKVRRFLPETKVEQVIYELLVECPKTTNELVRASGLSASDVGATLSILEMKGVVREMGRGEYKVV
ncbi:DNA-processing protein DprA [Patescibacteria group bacterium]|nr:DNA-processing protein DprA [Patescibacteria group bacterium]